MRVVGLGAGGHAKVVVEMLKLMGAHELVGLLDSNSALWGTEVLGVPVLGDDGLLPGIYSQGASHAFIGVGGVGDTGPRKRLYEMANRTGFQMVDVIHPSAVVSASAAWGQGLTAMAGAVINAGAQLGDNVIVNTGAIVEHDCVIGDHVHVATGARLASTVQVGDWAHIGLGASVRQCVHIGRSSIVGAGAVVVEDVPDNVVVVGVPARILKRVEV